MDKTINDNLMCLMIIHKLAFNAILIMKLAQEYHVDKITAQLF